MYGNLRDRSQFTVRTRFEHVFHIFKCILMFLSSGRVGTTLHHDAEIPSPLEANGSIAFKDINYNVTIGQILSLINSSSYCNQYVRVSCGPAWYDDPATSQLVKWVNRDGELMSNWGVPDGTTGCECGQSNGRITIHGGHELSMSLILFGINRIAFMVLAIP